MTAADRERAIATAAAHDLNEELTIVLGSIREARASIVGRDYGPLPRHLRLAEDATYRMVGLTRQVLTYSAERGTRPAFGHLESVIAAVATD